MTDVYLSPKAAGDLRQIVNYISKENPKAAKAAKRLIVESCLSLKTFPHRGRTGRMTGTRELVIPSLPYLAVYRVREDEVEIIRVYHMARDARPLGQ